MTLKSKFKQKFCLFSLIFFLLFSFSFVFAKEELMPIGTLLYKTSPNNKIYGKNTNILFKVNKLLPLDFQLNSGHTGIYVGKDENGVDMVVEAVAGGVVMDPLKYFVNLEKREKFLGAKIPKNSTKEQREAAAAIAKAIAKLKLKYDYSFQHQKGPKSSQWTCVGLTEKVYESATTDGLKIIGVENLRDNPHLVFQILTYNPSQYSINITPDGYDDANVYNKETGDVFSIEKEFSMIAPRKIFLESQGIYDYGRVHNEKRYFFLPFTQYKQKTLEKMPLSQDKINKLQSYFSKEIEEKYKGKMPIAKILAIGVANNISATVEKRVNQVKKTARFAKEKANQAANFVVESTKKAISIVVNKTKNVIYHSFINLGGAGVGTLLEKKSETLNKPKNENSAVKLNKTAENNKSEQKIESKLKRSNMDEIGSRADRSETQFYSTSKKAKKANLADIQETLDNISEQVDIINQKVTELAKQTKKEITLADSNKTEKKQEQNKKQLRQDSKQTKKNKQTNIQKSPNNCLPASININTASKEELDKLVGIGPTIAQRIIESRPFFSVQELTKVKGIGDKTLEKIIAQNCAYANIRSNHVSFGFTGKGGAESSSSSSNNNNSSSSNNNNSGNSQTCSYKSIDINTASKEDLDKLIGIGEVLAQRIINSRPFSSLDDLIKVAGIGDKTLEKIKEQGCAYVEKQEPLQPVLEVLPKSVEFSIIKNDTESQKETIAISNNGTDLLQWQSVIEYDSPSLAINWLEIQPSFGSILSDDSDNLSIFITDSAFNLTPGNYYATVSFSIIQENANNNQEAEKESTQESAKEVKVKLNVLNNNINNQNNDSKESNKNNKKNEENKDEENKENQENQEEQPSGEIVINEIAWMGTKASASDEWIELYNTTNQDIDISKWSIYKIDNDGQGKCLNFDSADGYSTLVVKANDYLVYASHKDDVQDSKGESLADIWDATISLNNSSAVQIMLYDTPNCQFGLVDVANQKSGSWAAGENKTKRTMERIDPSASGIDPNNWASNNLIVRKGFDSKGNPINGTPKAKNSVSISPTEITDLSAFSDDSVSEITLNFNNSPYIVESNLIVPENKILNIDPGVVLKFNGKYSGITINGTLKAIGGQSESEKIIFTSILDNDSESEKNAVNLSSGSWNKLYFTSKSRDSELENIIISYAGGGSGTPCSPEMSGIKVEASSINIKNSIIKNNQYRGLYLIDSNSIIDGVQFLNNSVCCPTCQNQYGGYGLEIEGGKPIIKNSIFKSNIYGIYVKNKKVYKDNQLVSETETEPIIENNNFQNNKESAIWLESGYPQFSGNQTENNGINGILIKNINGYLIKNNTTLSADIPYAVAGKLIVPEGKTLNIKPGVILKFSDRHSGIVVEGKLTAIGNNSDNEKIIFTSLKDDQYFGDTNNNKDASLPSPGDWDKIYFAPTSKDSKLRNIIVKYAGGGVQYPSAGIEIEKSGIDLENSLIENNQYIGLYFSSSIIDVDSLCNYPLTTIKEVVFSNNKKTINNQKQGYNLWIDGSNISVKDSIFKNSVYGIFIHGGNPTLNKSSLTFGIDEESNIKCNIYELNQGCICEVGSEKCVNP